MAQFLNDTFTNSNGTALSAHTGETGHTWTNGNGFAITGTTIESNKARSSAVNNIGYASVAPGAADYSVTGVFTALENNPAGGNNFGVAARVQVGATEWYTFTWNGLGAFWLYKSAATQLGSAVSASIASGVSYAITIDVAGTTISGRVQRLSDNQWLNSSAAWQAGQANCITVTDSSVTAAGRAGIWLSTSNGSSTGMVLESLTATDGLNDFTITDSSLFFSPYNWRLTGSYRAESNNPGAYLKTKFSGASCTLLLDTSHQGALSAGNYPALVWSVNGAAFQRSQLTAGQSTLSLATGLGSGPHTLEVYIAGAWWQSDRWTTPISNVRVTGIRLADGATLSAPTLYSGRMIVYGDSNGEGYESLAAGVSVANQDATVAYPLLLARSLECEVGVVAFAGQGYTATGGGNVPALSSAWNLYSSGQSRLSSGLFSPAPDYIVSAHGQNDGSSPQSAATTLISAWRTAAPLARIAICSPTDLNQASALQAAVSAAADSKIKWVTTGETIYISGGRFSNNNHLTGLRGHPRFAAALLGEMTQQFWTIDGTASGVGVPMRLPFFAGQTSVTARVHSEAGSQIQSGIAMTEDSGEAGFYEGTATLSAGYYTVRLYIGSATIASATWAIRVVSDGVTPDYADSIGELRERATNQAEHDATQAGVAGIATAVNEIPTDPLKEDQAYRFTNTGGAANYDDVTITRRP